MPHKAVPVLVFFFLLIPIFINPSWAKETNLPTTQKKLTENIQQRERERYLEAPAKEGAIVAKEKNYLLSFGGFQDLDYIENHNDDNNAEEKDVFDADLLVDSRIWVKGILRHSLGENKVHRFEHTLFTQFRNLYIARWPNKKQLLEGSDNDGPHVDLLYLDLDLQLATLRTGRQYLNLGQGITLADIYDAVKLTATVSEFQFEGFAATTRPHEDNIDYSVPGFDKKCKRNLFGGQTTWIPRENFRLYSYFLLQHDESKPDPDFNQDFAYHSQYWSLGGLYQAVRGYSLWGEYIFQTGSSAVYGAEKRQAILAHGLDLGVSYLIPYWIKPELSIEYSFGSGDRDRSNVTNTEGGNVNGRDHNFLPFGFFPTGYALSPTLSNIHILRTGISLKPFEKIWALRKLELSSNGYGYWKAVAKGGIYDIDATEPSLDIGREIDAALSWPIFSDFTASVRYGLFFPGKAFPASANDKESYLSTSASFSF